MMLFIAAEIMAILDGLLLIGQFGDGGALGVIVMMGLFVSQVMIAIWARQADN